jgi:uncharacterized membrane protein
MTACAALVLGGGLLFLRKGSDAPPTAAVVVDEAPAGEVSYAVSLFDDGEARFFQYEAGGGITVKYFVLKSSDGVIRAAFDACDSCWHAGKGYYQSDDDMVCRNCRRRFASVKVNEVKGGCNPAPLNREISDGKVVIRVRDILDGRQYFDFRRGGDA